MKEHLQRIHYFYLRKLWLLRPRYLYPATQNDRYSIGVVTYCARYERFFRPLIRELTALFPDTRITVGINGFYDQTRQREYLRQIKAYLESCPNVRSFEFMEGQSLSKLWNRLVINSPTEKTFIFNDDLLLLPEFRPNLEGSGILDQNVALINRSWSHFLISKSVIRKVGWFDERFPGVGNEDEDYESRLVAKQIPIPTYWVKGVKNIVFRTRDFSYGKNTEVVNVKYVKANKVFFECKWALSDESAPGFCFVPILGRYIRLKPGMETPDFYPEESRSFNEEST